MNEDEQRWMTVRETAKLLGIPRTRCYELIQSGDIPAVRVGERSIRVSKREVETFLIETRSISPAV